MAIHSNVPAETNVPGSFSHPADDYLWQRWFWPGEFTLREYGTGNQGWFDPLHTYNQQDHSEYLQVNITDIAAPLFEQKEGEVYWLDIQVAPITPNAAELGWKTSQDHFIDSAVYYYDNAWHKLYDPLDPSSEAPWDLAFVITPEPGTVVMLVSPGLIGLLVCVRHRRKR